MNVSIFRILRARRRLAAKSGRNQFSHRFATVTRQGGAMTNAPGIIERAYELCRSGDCPSIDAVRARLKQERYENVDSHLSSGSLKRDLRKLLAAGQLVKTK